MRNTLLILFSVMICFQLQAEEKPNILVLLFEDTSKDYLSAFGNTTIETPTFDRLAEDGVIFTHAYSNGPQCSSARSTFIRGMYASTVGAEWHRMDVATPDDFFFPRLLQREGYKTYLKGKHDFNTPKEHWNEELKIFDGTDYTQCPADVPFYGQYNFFDTHMSRITNTRQPGQRDDRTVYAEDIDTLDAYLPHTEWIMDDHAYHLHKITLFDEWLKEQLEKLEQTGRAENTIIFVSSDHGGCLPGSKGYIRGAGVDVPLIAYFPPKWAHLMPQNTDGVCDEIVEFADFAPTFFSLAGLEKPAYMQGRAFCGVNREEPKRFSYHYKANQAPNFIPSRAITDTKYRIIWNYNTVFPSGARQDFQWLMPGYRDWESHWRKGEYSGIYSYFFEAMEPIEFYDLEKDPGETVNLAHDPAYATLVEEYKEHLKRTVRETGDLGFFPQSIRAQEFTSKAVYDFVAETGFDMEAVYQAAELASMAEASDLPALLELMQSPEAVIRYWGSVGMLRLRFHNKIDYVPALVNQIAHNEDENIEVRCLNHCALLCDGQYCEVVDFFKANMADDYCKGIIHNMGDKLKPIAAELYKGFTIDNFYTKSLLINAGVIPYEELIDHTDLTIDTLLIEQADTLECDFEACHQLIYDDFSPDASFSEWSEIPSNDMMSLDKEALRVLYDKEKENVTARRRFDAIDQSASFSIKFKSDNTTSRTYFSLLNENDEPVAAFLIGTLEQVNGVFVISELKDLQASLEKDNIKTQSNYLPGVFSKDKFYTLVIDLDLDAQTFSILVDGNRSPSFPLLQPCTAVGAYDVYVEKMYNSGDGVYLDDFRVTLRASFTQDLESLIEESRQLLYSQMVGLSQDEELATDWQQLNTLFYEASDLLKNCDATDSQRQMLLESLQEALEAYQTQLVALDNTAAKISTRADFYLPSTFYVGDGAFAPRFEQFPERYSFRIYTVGGQALFTSEEVGQGWLGSTQFPLCLWELHYQLPGQSPQRASGKLVIFVD